MDDDRSRAHEDDRQGADEAALDPADAFALLGHPLRLSVVSALHERSESAPLSFSTLYEAADGDGTGQFNYHLDQLVPQFVVAVEDGYELSPAGERLARAVTAGTYTESPVLEPFGMDGHCYDCGAAALEGVYRDGRFRVDCRDCGRSVLGVGVPPSLVRGREPAAFVAAFDRWSRNQVEQASRGLCPDCGGAVAPGVEDSVPDRVPFDLLARYDCTVCGRSVVTSFGSVAAKLPAVRAFHDDRDAPLDEQPYWEVPQYMSDEHVEVLARDPVRVRVTFACGGDRCRVELDGSLRATEVDVIPEGADDEDA